jgi:putative cell wall-binding protein
MRPSRLVLALFVAATVIASMGSRADASSDPTSPDEMLFIYELNLMRWNPAAYGIDAEPTFPLAVNRDLAEAAEFKAEYMEQIGGVCTHTEPIWSNRIAADYGFPLPSWWSLDRNYIEASWCSNGQATIPSPTVFTESSSTFHRDLVLGIGGYAEHREVGVGYSVDDAAALSLMTAPRDGYDQSPPTSPMFVTGVVFDDTNGNGRMDLGEGTSGAQVTVGSWSTTTNPGGGYSILIPSSGTYSVSSPGAGTGSVTMASQNVGVDFVDGRSEALVHSFESTERWWGDDRYETAVAISQQTHASAATVYVAVGRNYPDAIAAGPAAAHLGAPILLVERDRLPTVTRDELIRLDPDRVVVVGGTAAITSDVLAAIDAWLGSGTADRVSGATRYETAAQISFDAFGPSVSTVLVTTGADFPDALVGAPGAIVEGGPLLLVRPDTVPQAVVDELVRLKPGRIILLGGPAAVGASVEATLSAHAPVERIDAANRYDLAAAVSQRFFGPSPAAVYVAISSTYPDALAGGAASGVTPGPMLLVPSTGIPSVIVAELQRLTPDRIVILGGPAAVPDTIAFQLAPFIVS